MKKWRTPSTSSECVGRGIVRERVAGREWRADDASRNCAALRCFPSVCGDASSWSLNFRRCPSLGFVHITLRLRVNTFVFIHLLQIEKMIIYLFYRSIRTFFCRQIIYCSNFCSRAIFLQLYF